MAEQSLNRARLIADSGRGVVIGSAASFHTGPGIPRIEAAVGVSSVCPSTIVADTIIANGGIIETDGDGWALANDSSC